MLLDAFRRIVSPSLQKTVISSVRAQLVTVHCARLLRSPSALAFCARLLSPPWGRVTIATRHIAGSTRRPSRPSRAACGPSRAARGPSRTACGPSGTACGPTRRFSRGDWGRNCASGTFSKRRLGFTHGRLGPLEATRGTDCAHAGATRRGDSATREAPRGGEGDDSLRRVARAGGDSPLRDAARHYRPPLPQLSRKSCVARAIPKLVS